MLITEAVFAKLHDKFICRELDFITVKGKTEPVRIYEILQEKNKAEDKIFDKVNIIPFKFTIFNILKKIGLPIVVEANVDHAAVVDDGFNVFILFHLLVQKKLKKLKKSEDNI